MEWLEPLWKELKNLLVPLCLAAAVAFYGFVAPSPAFLIAGAWALVVTVAMAVLRGLSPERTRKGDDEMPREMWARACGFRLEGLSDLAPTCPRP